MSDEDDNQDSAPWPPKQSGRRKIREGQPAEPGAEVEAEGAAGADTDGEEAPESGGFQLPGGIELNQAVRRALDDDDPAASVDVLRGVQERLRERSGGKFYGDGWSTTKHPPFATFFLTSLMMLAVVVVTYAILVPLVGDPIELPKEPQPINVISP